MTRASGPALQTLLFLIDAGRDREASVAALDALEILAECSHVPEYEVHLISESSDGVRQLLRLTAAYPRLRVERQTGKLVVKEMGGDAELAGRTCTTVVTEWSHRTEEWVSKALRAGSAVVAPRNGSAAAMIIQGVTGTLFPPGDIACLAAVLGAYLRNSAASQLMGQNAARLERIRRPVTAPDSQAREGAAGSSFGGWDVTLRFDEMAHKRAVVERLLRQPLTEFLPIEVGKHSAFRVTAGGERYFTKFFLDRSSDVSWVVPPGTFDSRRPARVAWNRSVFNSGNAVAPRVVAADSEAGVPVLVTEWVAETMVMDGESADQTVAAVAARCREFEPIGDSGLLAEYHARLDALDAEPGEEALAAFDTFSARLNAPVNGGFHAFARVHPQVELMRLRYLLQSGAWPVPHALRCRAIGAINLLLQGPLSRCRPSLAQTDPQPKHYLLRDEEPILCDFEHCLYVVGPLDEAFWLVDACFTNQSRASKGTALRRLRRMTSDDDMFSLGCAWLLAETLYQVLTSYVTGDTTLLQRGEEFLAELFVDAM